MAETTTATSWPASTSRLTWRATFLMRSISATEVPPNFITSRAMRDSHLHGVRRGRLGFEKGSIHNGGILRLQPHPWRRAMGTGGSTIDPAEVARFAALADTWWDPAGKMGMLHKFNPVRLGFIKEAACRRFGRDPKQIERRCG